MTHDEQYHRILKNEKEKELFAFFQSLTAKERKAFAPTVKRLGKEYLDYRQEGSSWKCKATDKQRTLLNYSFFACYDLKEIKKENPAWLLSREHLEKFLSWYNPSWLSDYVNSFGESDWLPHALDYGYLMDLITRGVVQPVPQLIAKILVPYIHENRDRKQLFRPDRLEEYDVTLNEHIWHLFQYETSVHYSNRYLYSEGKQVEKGWIDALILFVEKGKIDKHRLLQEALLASHRNFNKTLSGWFAELFIQLEPTVDETLSLQREIFNLFSSPHSKVVNTALQGCKLIADSARFDLDTFLDGAPLLLSNNTKSVVTSTLQLLEKGSKSKKDKRAQICLITTGAFIHKDEALQSRAAKLIVNFGHEDDIELSETLSLYKDALFSNAKALLQPYLSSKEEPKQIKLQLAAEETAQKKQPVWEAAALPIVINIDELIFLSSQAFDNNESWHIDLLPAALIRFQSEIKGEHLAKLEPAMQRALKLYFGDWRSTQGELDILLACFFLDYCLWLIEQFPEEGKTARELYSSFLSKNEENKKVWQEHGTSLTFLGGWKAEGRRFLYTAYRKLLEAVLYGLKNRIVLPVLSEPTHSPAWIDPFVLVERIAEHQQQDGTIDDTDLQIALSRCWLNGTENAIQLANEKLQGEIRCIMLFLLDQEQEPKGPYRMETAWMTAALRKSPETQYPALAGLKYAEVHRPLYTGQYPYEFVVETYVHDFFEWKNGKLATIKKTAEREVIKVDLSLPEIQKTKADFGLKKFFKKLAGKEEEKKAELAPLLYDYNRFKEKWLSVEDKDIRRVYMLTPNNPEPLLAQIIDKCLSNPELSGEATKQRIVINTLQALHDTWKPLGETGHLLLQSVCFRKIRPRQVMLPRSGSRQ